MRVRLELTTESSVKTSFTSSYSISIFCRIRQAAVTSEGHRALGIGLACRLGAYTRSFRINRAYRRWVGTRLCPGFQNLGAKASYILSSAKVFRSVKLGLPMNFLNQIQSGCEYHCAAHTYSFPVVVGVPESLFSTTQLSLPRVTNITLRAKSHENDSRGKTKAAINLLAHFSHSIWLFRASRVHHDV